MKLGKEKFGRTDYRVSELCLGTSNFARYTSREESFAILDAFREAGGNLVQTSGICPGVSLGDSFLGMPEEVLGRWLKERQIHRDDIVIATRIALTRPIVGGLETYTGLIRQCADDSIRRIGCRYLDFLVVEWTDAIAPVPESIAAFEAVIAAGAVRHVVAANFPSWRVQEGLAASRSSPRSIAGLQLDYSLATRTALEGSAAKLSADYDLGVITRSPLAGGHLASRPLSTGFGVFRMRHAGPSDRHAAIAAEGLWPALTAIARTRCRSPAQVSLSWVLSHREVTSVLVSVSSAAQLHELLAATRLHLTADDLCQLGSRPGVARARLSRT